MRGGVLYDAGRHGESLAAYDEAARLKPGSADVHLGRGTALEGLGRLSEAADAFGEAARIDPGNAYAARVRDVLRHVAGGA